MGASKFHLSCCGENGLESLWETFRKAQHCPGEQVWLGFGVAGEMGRQIDLRGFEVKLPGLMMY